MDEVTTLGVQIGKLKEEMQELTTEIMKDQKMVFEKMQMEFEKELFEKVEYVLLEAKCGFNAKMNKMIIAMVFGFMIMFGLFMVL